MLICGAEGKEFMVTMKGEVLGLSPADTIPKRSQASALGRTVQEPTQAERFQSRVEGKWLAENSSCVNSLDLC